MIKKYKKIFLVILVAFFFGLVPGPARALSDKIYKELATFSNVIDIIDKFYVSEVDERELVHGAIDGMLLSLDPHTVYLPADVYKDFTSDTRGRFGGIGIEVSVKDGVLTIVAPIEDTPAWEAGLQSGDRILAIDGDSTKYMSLGQAVHLMRGPIGRPLSITIWRQGKTRSVTLKRRLIKVPGVKVEDLGEGLALFRITTFQEGVTKSLKKELLEFRKRSGELNGFILDLRNNPGGLLDEAIKVSDLFLEKGVIVSTKGRDKKAEVKKAHKAGTLTGAPVIVLVNEGSASASEIVAAALGDNSRATLMGTKTFGKGSVQTIVNLDNGDALKITIAHYYTPKNKLIDGKGIVPDVVLDQAAYKKKTKTKSKSEGPVKVSAEEFDAFQKGEALKYLKKLVK